MKYDMHKLAKLVVESDPSERKSLWNAIQGGGYEGTPQQFTRDLASTLLAVWDGKASTLDQASAWRSVWDCCYSQDLVNLDDDMTPLGKILDLIHRLREQKAKTTSIQIEAPTGKWDDAALARLLEDVRQSDSRLFSGTQYANYAALEERVTAWIASNPMLTLGSAGVGQAIAAPYGKAPKAIGKMIDKRGRAKGEDFEIQSVVGGTEDKWVVLDMDGMIRHPHCKAWALQLYASEHPFGCPCDKCCRPFGGVPISRTGDPIEPANDNQPDQGSASYPHLMRKMDNGVWFSVGNVKAVEGGWTVDNEFGDRARFIPADGYELTLYAGEGSDDLSLDMAEALRTLAAVVEPARLDVMRRLLVVQDTCYGLANAAGWWTDLETGQDVRSWPKKHIDNWVSAKLMLTVTEVAEAMEGHRKGLTDDKLPNRPMLEVELADAVIRIMDLAGGLNLDVAGAIVEKLAYNMTRKDHQIENRKAAGGKSV